MKISVVVPVYGCRAALVELHDRLKAEVSKISEEYEIILVNDNCPQNSWEVIEELCKKDNHVVGIELARNFGQIQAITAGLDYSTGDWVVVMDCDLQDRPEEIVNLYNKAQEGYDVVFARRTNRKDNPFKILASKIFYKLYSIATDGNYDATISNFSICQRKVIDAYCNMRELHRAFTIYIKWLGFRQTSIDVEHNERKEGKSSYNFSKRLKLAEDILTSQSDKMLKLTVRFGFIITLLSVIAIIVVVIQHLFINQSITTGWTSTIATICLMGGLSITSIGVVGLYVGNIFMQSKQRPLYITRTILENIKDK